MPAIKTNKNNPKKALPRAPSFLSQHSIPQILPQMLLYYMTAYYQCLKSGGKTQKTNTTTAVEITKQGGKAVKLKKKKKKKNMISLRREPSQLHQMITLFSPYVIFY